MLFNVNYHGYSAQQPIRILDFTKIVVEWQVDMIATFMKWGPGMHELSDHEYPSGTKVISVY